MSDNAPSPVAVYREGHPTFLKWHRARRRFSDTVFTGKRIAEGMRLGASVEIDIQRHASGGFVVLHDHTLDRETSGSGLVGNAHAADLRNLTLRDNDGGISTDRVMVLEDLVEVLTGGVMGHQACLQFDLKNSIGDLSHQDAQAFGDVVSPISRYSILSGGDADAVALLSQAAPEISVGFDPCYDAELVGLAETAQFGRFVSQTLSAMPTAEMIYLHYRIVLAAADAGTNLARAFQQEGKKVDAYTISQATPKSFPVLSRLVELGVDQITTDDPEGVAGALNAAH